MSHAYAPAPELSPALIFEILNAHQRTAALRAAIELGVFRALGEGPLDAPALAARCGAAERGIRILCDFLTVAGLVRKEANKYSHTPASAAFLDPGSPACIAPIARFLGLPEVVEVFDNLTEIVRTGRTVLPGAGSVEPNHPMWVEFAHHMAPMMAPMAAPLADAVLDGITGPIRVLDIAAGHGLFGIEVAKRHREAEVTAIDWALVLEVARANAQKAGVEDRYHLLPGSAFEADYGGPYNIALLTNFLHHFDAAACIALLRRVRAAMKPGARVAALEFVPDEDRVSPPIPAMFAMMMLANTAAGDAYTLSDYRAMYDDAGFAQVTGIPVPGSPHTIVHAVAC